MQGTAKSLLSQQFRGWPVPMQPIGRGMVLPRRSVKSSCTASSGV
ncbi:Uncharacterized protein pbN1_05880 [Aromatoleum bremense]|nr:Uncharacterized protein pbN1_05880 [Aromatoleum bremense]